MAPRTGILFSSLNMELSDAGGMTANSQFDVSNLLVKTITSSENLPDTPKTTQHNHQVLCS